MIPLWYPHKAADLTYPVASSSDDRNARSNALELTHTYGRTGDRADMAEKSRGVHLASDAVAAVGGGASAANAARSGCVGNA